MQNVSPPGPVPHTMRSRLIRYMLVLIATILAVALSALFLMGQFRSTRQELSHHLELQLDFMEEEVASRNENLAAMGVELSHTASVLLEEYLARQGLPFSELTGNADLLTELQSRLILPLRGFLLRSECSGVFLMLHTSVSPDSGDESRSGLYLQKQGASVSDDSILLYRGNARTGKKVGIMPHRKWRLEFQSDLFSHFDRQLSGESESGEPAYACSPVLTLPGTSEQALLLFLPVCGSGGELYGVCGFEVSASYFKLHCTQPALLPHLSLILSRPETADLLPEAMLVAGTTDGFFSAPAGPLSVIPASRYLTEFHGTSRSYIGSVRSLPLFSDDDTTVLAAMLPMEEYQHLFRSSFAGTVLLVGLILIFAVFCCILFSRQYLFPILRSMDQIKRGGKQNASGIQEIDDLFLVLSQRDQSHADSLRMLETEKQDAQSRADMIHREYDEILSRYRQTRKEATRLADAHLLGTDSQAYHDFLDGLKELTPTEKEIFRYYLEGMTGREIMDAINIKESTLRYHNHNIYGKLGVRSLKQLLQFAAMMQNQNR